MTEGIGISLDQKFTLERDLFLGEFTIQTSAINLYNRGLNVFPVPRPDEIRLLAMQNPVSYSIGDKRPYILKPLFLSRMHLCDDFCKEQTLKTGQLCKGGAPDINFESLFSKANLAVMLGKTSKNLVCLDCDSPKSFGLVFDQFQVKGLPFWAYTTSRGCNLLFQAKEMEIKTTPRSRIPDVEIWGREHFCVLPPSIHSSGEVYTWIKDHNPFEGEWMALFPRCQLTISYGLELKKKNLMEILQNLMGFLPGQVYCQKRTNRYYQGGFMKVRGI